MLKCEENITEHKNVHSIKITSVPVHEKRQTVFASQTLLYISLLKFLSLSVACVKIIMEHLVDSRETDKCKLNEAGF